MRRHKRLLKLRWTAHRNLLRIERRASEIRLARSVLSEQRLQIECTSIALNLQNAWGNFLRAYLISCCLGTISERGNYFFNGAGITTEEDALGMMIKRLRPTAKISAAGKWNPQDEPSWHAVDKVVLLSSALALSNDAFISTAFSTGSTAYSDLPKVRNYFAHRNQHSLDVAMTRAPSYGVSRLAKPSEFILFHPTKRAPSVIEDWTLEFRNSVFSLCQ
jgi:hypothetical protein